VKSAVLSIIGERTSSNAKDLHEKLDEREDEHLGPDIIANVFSINDIRYSSSAEIMITFLFYVAILFIVF